MNKPNRSLIAVGAFSMAMAVILGALGAHALESSLEPDQLDSFKTGVRYQVWHSLTIIILGFSGVKVLKPKSVRFISNLMISGIVLFSFSIYLLSCRDILGISNAAPFLGPITPLGGSLLIAAWFLFGFKVLRERRGNS